jgi:hypothetical protein
MTTQIETINGRTYRVTRDDDGAILTQAAADTLPAPPARPAAAQIRALITAPLPLTAVQRDRAIQLLLALASGLLDA